MDDNMEGAFNGHSNFDPYPLRVKALQVKNVFPSRLGFAREEANKIFMEILKAMVDALKVHTCCIFFHKCRLRAHTPMPSFMPSYLKK